jgi:hypothetical protein
MEFKNDDEIVAYIRKTLLPEEVFSEDELSEWAVNNGFTDVNE